MKYFDRFKPSCILILLFWVPQLKICFSGIPGRWLHPNVILVKTNEIKKKKIKK